MIKNNFKKGFTLLEALVAISILMVAVVAPITIAQKGLSSSIYSKNQMIASYLAQDAIEYVKNKRDVVAINNNNDWDSLTVFTDCIVTDPDIEPGCQIDTIEQDTSSAIVSFSENQPLLKNGDGFYGYTDGEPTNFTRRITIETKDIDGVIVDPILGSLPTRYNEALVTVTVSWGEGDNFVTVKTLIYNY